VENSVAIIQSFAASAAGVAAMGCRTVKMSPVGTIMIHNVSCSGVSGDYHDMDTASGMLRTLNRSMANAYAVKSGRPIEDMLEIMDKETWISAEEALEYGFIDEIIQPEQKMYTNAFEGLRLTPEIYQRAIKEKEKLENDAKKKEELLKDLDLYGV
jgi:ATP-dependent protease ClpP protease subunit